MLGLFIVKYVNIFYILKLIKKITETISRKLFISIVGDVTNTTHMHLIMEFFLHV